jgi:hypothetical protein
MSRGPRFTLLRLLAAVAATAPVFALAAGLGTPSVPALIHVGIASAASAGVALCAPSLLPGIGWLLAVYLGTLMGVPFVAPCSGEGNPAAAVGAGLLVVLALRGFTRRYLRPFES